MPVWDFRTGRGATKIAEKHLIDQTAAIAETILCTATGIAPAYLELTVRVPFYIVCTQAGSSGTARVRFRWTDHSGTGQVWTSSPINLNNVGDGTSDICLAEMPDGNTVTYEVIVTGGGGPYKYALFLHAEQM